MKFSKELNHKIQHEYYKEFLNENWLDKDVKKDALDSGTEEAKDIR
ncbi:MAG: hypothetical protein ACFFG0_20620 [Candidatus Thorarchaeota archaeon]